VYKKKCNNFFLSSLFYKILYYSPMNIGILVFSEAERDFGSASKELLKTATDLGHTAKIFFEPFFTFEHTEEGLKVFYEGILLEEKPDVWIARPNFIEEPMPHGATLEALQELQTPILNGNASAILISKEKLAQHLAFKRAGIPMPPWAIVRSPKHAVDVAKRISFPVIIKVPFGTQGKGVFFAHDTETFCPIVEYLNVRDGNPLIIEKFIAEANRCDIRVLVLNGKVAAAMERRARPGDVRANASIGGQGFPVELSKEEEELALRATKTIGLDLAGVDILRSKNGPLIIEINANPGFTELEKATGIDVAKLIVKGAIELAETPAKVSTL
jgi:ribosomal protein S6--L-glutamate ligase